MTAVTIAPTAAERPQRSALGWAVADTKTIAWRNLVTLRRLPQLLVFATVPLGVVVASGQILALIVLLMAMLYVEARGTGQDPWHRTS